mmetsp:Transcript_22872/g.47437  ORF Transcript_22872/g.47437 Transcript_22872/m.47437 type:complete len:284 (-) Transcript_22872:132-983(-)
MRNSTRRFRPANWEARGKRGRDQPQPDATMRSGSTPWATRWRTISSARSSDRRMPALSDCPKLTWPSMPSVMSGFSSISRAISGSASAPRLICAELERKPTAWRRWMRGTRLRRMTASPVGSAVRTAVSALVPVHPPSGSLASPRNRHATLMVKCSPGIMGSPFTSSRRYTRWVPGNTTASCPMSPSSASVTSTLYWISRALVPGGASQVMTTSASSCSTTLAVITKLGSSSWWSPSSSPSAFASAPSSPSPSKLGGGSGVGSGSLESPLSWSDFKGVSARRP